MPAVICVKHKFKVHFSGEFSAYTPGGRTAAAPMWKRGCFHFITSSSSDNCETLTVAEAHIITELLKHHIS